VLTHYFDTEGNTFAFEKQTNFFNSGCTEGVAYETETKFYNTGFELIARQYKLVDEKGKDLSKDSCAFLYKYETIVSPRAVKYLKSHKINIPSFRQ
jgi:hypothetical protein